jgi:hypothetical protein
VISRYGEARYWEFTLVVSFFLSISEFVSTGLEVGSASLHINSARLYVSSANVDVQQSIDLR